MNDERMDQILKALTTAEAPEGLEQRVLRRLEAQPTETPVARRWHIPAYALGACALVTLVIALRSHGTPPVAPTPIVANRVTPRSALLKNIPPAPHKRVARYTPKPPSPATTEVSYPAPPAPLTEQEKLLVKFAQARQREATQGVDLASASQKPKDAEVPLTHEEVLLVAVSRTRQDAIVDALDPVRRAAAEARERQEFNVYVQKKDGGSL